MHRFLGLCAAFLMFCVAPLVHGEVQPDLAVAVDVRHMDKDLWRVDYRFAQAVTSLRFMRVGEYRQQAWKILTPGLRLQAGADSDVISSSGKPFTTASVEITTYTALPQKDYSSFNRFSDGGTAVYLGHLQGDAMRGDKVFAMRTEIRLAGLPQENVIAPPPNRMQPGAGRGYAYFGPAQAASAGKVKVVIDPQTPDWLRESILDIGAKVSAYYEKAYQRQPKDELLIMVSVDNFESPGFSMTGGALIGQVSYRLEGKQLLGDPPKKRELAARNVSHEMAHIWQSSVARGGMGEQDPWIHEGGADAMALDALVQSGVSSEESVKAYRAQQTARCETLGGAVDSYDGIYACGLMRFDKLGVGIVPLWRAMMEATEATGAVYSRQMIDAIVSAK